MRTRRSTFAPVEPCCFIQPNQTTYDLRVFRRRCRMPSTRVFFGQEGSPDTSCLGLAFTEAARIMLPKSVVFPHPNFLSFFRLPELGLGYPTINGSFETLWAPRFVTCYR